MIDHWICTLFVKSMLLSIEIVHLTLNNSIRICLVLVSVFSAVYITIFTLLLSRWNWFNKADYTAWVVSCVTSSLLYCTATSHSELQLLNFALSDSFIRHCACVRVFVCSSTLTCCHGESYNTLLLHDWVLIRLKTFSSLFWSNWNIKTSIFLHFQRFSSLNLEEQKSIFSGNHAIKKILLSFETSFEGIILLESQNNVTIYNNVTAVV